MPVETLSALNARSTPFEHFRVDEFTASVSGTFVGTVRLERRVTPEADWEPVARDLSGNFVEFTAPSGTLPMMRVDSEGSAQLSWLMSAYTSGAAVVRFGRP